MRRTRTLIAATTLAGVLALSGCQSDGPDEIPDVPTPTGSASADRPAWYDDYSPEQIKAYEAAVRLIETSDRALEPIWQAGQATPQAQETFQRYRADWQLYWISLNDNQADGITLTRRPEVLSSRPVSIEVGDEGASVVVEQCVDNTVVVPTQNGEPLTNVVTGPTTRTVYVSQYGGEQLLRDGQEEVKPCDG